MYITVDELRSENIPEDIPDSKIVEAVLQAEEYIKIITGRDFELKYKVFKLDGKNSKTIYLPEFLYVPIEVKVDNRILSGDEFYVYNNPYGKNRWYPRIGFKNKIRSGCQNIQITGMFGFVEEYGGVPLQIKKVCKMLSIRELDITGSMYDKKDDYKRSNVVKEKTDDHSYELSELILTKSLTGDRRIDDILLFYSDSGEVRLSSV